MKIVHLITGLTNGGAEAVLTNLVTADQSAKHVVISMQDEAHYGQTIIDHNIALHCLNMPKGRLSLSGLTQLYRLLKKESPDIIQTWMYHADLVGGCVGRLAGTKNIVWGMHHSTLDPKKNSLSLRLIVKICALISHFIPRKIICCSNATKLVHERAGYASNKLVVAFNGYDISKFSKSINARKTKRQELGITDDMILLGMVGRWNPQKDHMNLISALSLLSDNYVKPWRCILIGEGLDDENTEIINEIKNNSLSENIKLLGLRTDIPELMNALDLHVLSSAFGEAFPNVVSESMSCGTPCVVTDVGDASFIVGDTGWTVEPKKPEPTVQCSFTSLCRIPSN